MTTTSSPARDPGRSQPTAEHVKAVLTYARGRTLVVHRTSCFQGRSQGSGDGWRCDEHFDRECSQGAGITARRRKEPDETCEAKPPRYGQRDGDWRVRSAVLHHDVDRPPSDRESTRTSSSHGGRPTPAHDIPHQERGSDEHANHTQHDDRISAACTLASGAAEAWGEKKNVAIRRNRHPPAYPHRLDDLRVNPPAVDSRFRRRSLWEPGWNMRRATSCGSMR